MMMMQRRLYNWLGWAERESWQSQWRRFQNCPFPPNKVSAPQEANGEYQEEEEEEEEEEHTWLRGMRRGRRRKKQWRKGGSSWLLFVDRPSL